MSFLGSIGHLMQGSGLTSLFEQIYAEQSVQPILSGKEMSRGTRAHTLLYGTLMGIIVSKVLAIEMDTVSSYTENCEQSLML